MIKSKHRAISLVLVVILAISAFCASGFSAFAVTTGESSVSAGGTLVYVKNTKNWSVVKIHYWGSEETNWPGKDMSLVSGTTDTYYYEVPSGTTGIIFNGNGNGDLQTRDLTLSECAGKVYDPSADSFSDYTGPAVSTDPTTATNPTETPAPGGNIVYLQNDANWSTVYCYMWNGEGGAGNENASWPGVAMQNTGNGVWSYNIPASYEKIIFNSGSDTNKTDDMSYPGTGYIYNNSTGQWSVYSGSTTPTNPSNPTNPTNPTTPTTPPVTGENVVYCQNDAGWSAVYCYMWNSETDRNGAWPGVRMQDLGDGVWFYEVPKDYANIIFNVGSDANKTNDLTYPGSGHIYNNKTGQWDIYDTSPIRITNFSADVASPQYVGMNITITASATSSGGAVSYKYTVTNTATGSTVLLSNYGTANTVVWTPTVVGEYVITVDVKDTAGNENQRTMNYTVQDDSTLVKPIIKGITPSNNSQIKLNTQVTVEANAGGGKTGTNLLFCKYIVTDPDGKQNIPYYTLNEPYKLTPTKLGTYTVQVFVQGSDNQTVNKTYTYTCVTETTPTQNPSSSELPSSSSTTAPTTSPSVPDVGGLLGDVTEDGELNVRDATQIQMYLADYVKFTDRQKRLADIHQDGDINIKDATKIQFIIAHLEYNG